MEAAAVMARAAGENFPVASRALPRRLRRHLLALYGFARLVDEIGDSGPDGGGVGPDGGGVGPDGGGVGPDGGGVGPDGGGVGPVGAGVASVGAGERPNEAGAQPTGVGAELRGEVSAETPQARLAALDELERELDRAFEGRATRPLLVALEPTLRECRLPREPFARLIEANRVDQRVSAYDTWEQLRGYCALSANPVGELVLHVFDAATPARVRRSDAICTALQLAEHCQDVAEDLRRGRVYLPAEDLQRFGCSAADLHAEHARPGIAAVLAFEVGRARGLLAQGAPLIDELEGLRERLAVAAFVAGGRAALEAVERAGFDVLAGPPRAGGRLRLRALAATLAGAARVNLQAANGQGPDTQAANGQGPDTQGACPRAAYPQAAYRQCERITRAAAANFYYGIRLLPAGRRAAMCAVYAFARRIDDIGDGPLPAEQKLQRLDEQTRALASLDARVAEPAGQAGERAESVAVTGTAAPAEHATASPDDPVLIALEDAYRRFAIPPDALPALIAGVRMDIEGARYETFDELVVYCRRVAGAIGRACLAIFALRPSEQAGAERAWQLADDLGVALQLTNILRDVREDAELGRCYLPAEQLRRFEVIAAGQEAHAPALIAALARGEGQAGQLEAMIRDEAARARAWFQRGIALTALLDRRSAACLLAMAGIYGKLLERIEADPGRALRVRVHLTGPEKAWVAARSLVGAATGPGAAALAGARPRSEALGAGARAGER